MDSTGVSQAVIDYTPYLIQILEILGEFKALVYIIIAALSLYFVFWKVFFKYA